MARISLRRIISGPVNGRVPLALLLLAIAGCFVLTFHYEYEPWRRFAEERGLWRGVLDSGVNRGLSEGRTRKLDCGEFGVPELPLPPFWGSGDYRGFPEPQHGSYDVFGLSSTTCMSSKVRYSPYTSANTSPSNGRLPWQRDDVDFARLQRQRAASNPESNAARDQQRSRTAVVLRAWDGFEWTDDDIRNARALVVELALFSAGKYELFILLHVRDASDALPKLNENLEDVKLRFVPPAFVNMTELWTYADVEAAYPEVGEYDVYYHTFMPVQLFVARHPEFDFVWNWEMDVRYTGHYGELFSAVTRWADKQPMKGLLERNARFYIPSYHGSYEHYANVATAAEVRPSTPTPWITADLDPHNREDESEADLITFFPIFDTSKTAWPHKGYVVNFQHERPEQRYASVGTNVRLSRTMLEMMHHENMAGRAMMSEMWTPTLAFHHGLKAVYVPHPIFLDRQWPAQYMQKTFNGGRGGQVGGSKGSVISHERDFEGSTWYWNSRFPLQIYKRWLGQAEKGPGSSKVRCEL
ncbi:hypothetical protein LTR08_004485 [Meristemomyces frigidus]|nr:hypothetical protein LTR08_004485 [Meristemomyces frigidus]